ncbi:iron-sulfur cluster assembly scaffold protein [Thermoplasmatales archaeon SM1-50]|nr:MAG: iron-sulfur cluster assembly scaffold protein [Thermoplasmatales archaeon SM1-50]
MVEDNLEVTIKELQKKIDHDEEQAYSKTVIREYRNPTNFGVLKHPDAVGVIKGSCGDTLKIYLKIRKGKITDARFWTDGCGATLASGNMLLRMIKGKTLQEANTITNTKLIEALERLPQEHYHCALLAVNTLHAAVKQYI